MEEIKKASEITYDDINIVYEDNHVLVVVKPINIPVQEDSSEDNDLLNVMKKYLVEKYGKEGDAYLGLVHRLDRPTGGVMVFAKTSKAAARLCESIKSGDFEKKYLAVVSGEPKESRGKLTHYLLKNESQNKVFCVPLSTEGAKKAMMEYRTIEAKNGTALLSIKILTGRSHQIRVQLQTIGHPIVGDKKYNENDALTKKCNLALWAMELRFTHPTTKEKMIFRVAPPVETLPWSFYDVESIVTKI